MRDLLKKRFDKLQSDYLLLLKKIDISTGDYIDELIIDQINLFWYSNKEIVNLYLEYVLSKNDSLVYTAASYFDTDDRNKDAFMILGNYHLFDDPLPDYIEQFNDIPDKNLKKQMGIVLKDLIKNNIKLIEKIEQSILVLPLRYLIKIFSDNEEKKSHKMSVKIFLSLFSGIDTIEEYYAQIESISDLEVKLKENVKDFILLSSEDDNRNSLEERISIYVVENADYFVFEDMKIAQIFFMALYGRIRQALAMFEICLSWNLIPFSEAKVPQHYFNMIANLMLDFFDLEESRNRITNIINKSNTIYVLNVELLKKDYDISIDIMKSKVKELNLEDLLYEFNNENSSIPKRVENVINIMGI